ncbi:VC0807 family protein [Dokdonella sp.]|uniref:VC0807 family protein n=1 Tax=Dokdonella sp. TaxID=2291710 RepID=UPI0025C21BB9|nr:VC0807 family protein [Dokdonella sp.]MBX3688616.1 hypothetical protein [Dokdonella sp.]
MKKRIVLDLFFYLAMPLIAWNVLRGHFSDYLLILIGLVPGLIYTLGSFMKEREWSVSGLFFLVIISANLTLNLLSSTAEQELWNPVWLSYASIVFYAMTMLAGRPLGIFFFIDYAHSRGIPRERSRALYRRKSNIHYFYKFTAFLMLREVASIAVKTYLIERLGVAGFNEIQLASSAINYAFTGLMVMVIIYILRHIDHSAPTEQEQPA